MSDEPRTNMWDERPVDDGGLVRDALTVRVWLAGQAIAGNVDVGNVIFDEDDTMIAVQALRLADFIIAFSKVNASKAFDIVDDISFESHRRHKERVAEEEAKGTKP